MHTLLAHSPLVGGYLIVGAFALLGIAEIWLLVVAAKRGILWLIAVLCFPIVNVVLIFVDSQAFKPWLLHLCAAGLIFYGYTGTELDSRGNYTAKEKIAAIYNAVRYGGSKPSDKESKPSESLEARQARIRGWQNELEIKRASLNPNDPIAKAAFEKELREYMAELQKVKDEIAKAAAR